MSDTHDRPVTMLDLVFQTCFCDSIVLDEHEDLLKECLECDMFAGGCVAMHLHACPTDAVAQIKTLSSQVESLLVENARLVSSLQRLRAEKERLMHDQEVEEYLRRHERT